VHYAAFTSSSSPRHLLFAFCDICNIAGTVQQQAYPKAYSLSVQMSGILLPHRTATQHSNYSRLQSADSKPVKLQQAALHNGVAKNDSLLDLFSPHGLQNTILQCDSYVAQHTVYIGLFLPGLFGPNDRSTAILRKANHFQIFSTSLSACRVLKSRNNLKCPTYYSY